MKQLNFCWRLLATGWSFLQLFVGALLLALTVMPLAYLWPGCARAKHLRARKIVHYAFRYFVFSMRILGVLSFSKESVDQLHNAHGTVVIANHPSLIDVVLLISLMPDANCIVKAALLDSFFLGGVVRATGYIRNSTDPQALLQSCESALAQGESIIVFPEGTRTVESKGLKMQRGTAHIALYAQANITPVVITCEPPTLKKGDPWYRIPAEKPHFSVSVRKRIDIEQVIEQETKLETAKASRQLTRYLTEYYQTALEQA